MKITEVTIVLQPNTKEVEDGKKEIVLYRDNKKLWSVEEGGVERGLFPYEVRLAHDLQELVVSKFNAGDNK